MSRPLKHPKTGVYYFRKAVPEALRPVVGKREEKISLDTKDPFEAKVGRAKVSARIDMQWKALRAQPEAFMQCQIAALAGAVLL